MDNYIEFIHEQSGVSIGDTFTNISTNGRLVTFEVITKDFFKYTGWYSYFRYEDDTKVTLLDHGKCYLNEDGSVIEYKKDEEQKIIYNG